MTPPLDAAVAAAQQASHNPVKVRWDWSMPTFAVDKKTFVPTTDTSDPDWFQGGSYIKGP